MEGIEHFIMQIAEEGILGRELENALIMMARAQSKELDKEYKNLIESKGVKV